MDKITQSLLAEFSKSFEIEDLPEDQRFEHLSAYVTIRRHYSDSAFSPDEYITGKGNDTGIDAIAVIVNNNLVSDVDAISELLEINKYLDVTFVFVQAERSPNFDGSKISNFGYGVRDFFGDGKLKRNENVQNFRDIMAEVYNHSSKFKPGNPSCFLYYVTTGNWQADKDLVAKRDSEVSNLKGTGLFSKVEFHTVGADQLHKLYRQTQNAITKEFVFDKKTTIPEVKGVKEAHLGFLPAKAFLDLIRDDSKQIIKSLFYDNIRDWVGYNDINTEIRATLLEGGRDRFILMNNGVTIIARVLQTTGDKFTMSDFQIVNGCQTSHVLHHNEDALDDSVRIPVRLIATQDEGVIEAIITATNRQTEVGTEQFFAMKDMAKKLEAFFRSYPPERRLYYERRAHQYDSEDIAKARIVPHQNLVRAVGAMFLGEPQITTRSFRTLSSKVGKEFFVDTDKFEPYYVAAYALHKLEQQFGKKIDARYKAARYQILLAVRLLMDPKPLPPMNSKEMAKRCEGMTQRLWDSKAVDQLFVKGAQAIDKIAGTGWDRDSIRTEPVTKGIFQALQKI